MYLPRDKRFRLEYQRLGEGILTETVNNFV